MSFRKERQQLRNLIRVSSPECNIEDVISPLSRNNEHQQESMTKAIY